MTHVVEGGLARLIEAEARLADAVAAAERDAETLRARARAAAGSAADGLAARLEQDRAALARRIAAERDDEITRLDAAAASAECRLRELPTETIRELAAWVESKVLATDVNGAQA